MASVNEVYYCPCETPHDGGDHGLLERLKAFAETEKVKVIFKALAGETRGYSTPGEVTIDPNYQKADQACTLAHELAHEYLHQRRYFVVPADKRKKGGSAFLEVEAETAGAVVASAYGLDYPTENYLACCTNGNGAKGKTLDRMERIREAANWILDGTGVRNG